MRRIVVVALVALIGAGGYIAAPFYTVWQIREAMRSGNSDYLAAKIEWPSLKETLKPTIARMALNLPPELTGEAPAPTEPAKKPSMWQRFKAYWGQGVVNTVVDKYVTPEGLPKLFTYRKTYKDVRDKVASTITGAPDERELALSERIRRFWARVERAEFKSLTRFEIDVRDKLMPERRFDGVMELRGLEWKLTELRVRDGGEASDVVADSGIGPAETLPTDK